ncbi:putative Carbohydrate sulfotransferase 12 [Daphnia magna]|uniref:Carbohydrate sulfotransferase n=1 Tax=Daphnia magna TaxID=35525 RepID=A0A164QDQ8_9CRUS|nr:putative Carbohydrate sulfotransferase 12 [Daphnia magna]
MFGLNRNRCARQIFFSVVVCTVYLMVLSNHLNLNALPKNLPTVAMMEKIQLERKNLLKQKCSELKLKSKTSPRPVRFKIEDRHRVMYCEVPKAATTNLKGLMLVLSGKFDIADLLSIPRLKVHEKNEMRKLAVVEPTAFVKEGVGNYTKFIFVRHPFERLVSAYESKFGSTVIDDRYQRGVGTNIIRKYRQNPTAISLEKGDDVTFVEFVNFVIDKWKLPKERMDAHWLSVIELCFPCSIEYDFIGKVETLEQDVSFLLQKLNETDLIPSFQEKQKAPNTTQSVWRQTMKQLSQQQMDDLISIYADDFKIFGYSLDNPLQSV